MAFDLVSLMGELTRRESLAIQVDAILRVRLKKDIRHKTRRGLIQTLVAEELGVHESSKLRTLINERMALMGFPKCILHGNAFYRNALIVS